MMQQQGVMRQNSDRLIEFDEGIIGNGTDARLVLGEEIRHSILSLTMPKDRIST